jgi:hypothetical protein
MQEDGGTTLKQLFLSFFFLIGMVFMLEDDFPLYCLVVVLM